MPKEVRLTETRAFPISVEVLSLDGTDLPEQIQIHADQGEFLDTGTADTIIGLDTGSGRTILSLQHIAPSKHPISIYASSVEDPTELFSKGVEVKVRQQSIIEVLEVPKNALANEKMSFQPTAVVKDQWGEPMAGVPCFVRSYVSRKYSVVTTHSNERGYITYMTPVVSEAITGFSFILIHKSRLKW